MEIFTIRLRKEFHPVIQREVSRLGQFDQYQWAHRLSEVRATCDCGWEDKFWDGLQAGRAARAHGDRRHSSFRVAD